MRDALRSGRMGRMGRGGIMMNETMEKREQVSWLKYHDDWVFSKGK